MPDIKPSDADWKKFQQGLQSDATPEVSSPYSPAVEGGINLVKGFGKGAAKGVAGMIPESIEGKDWKDWSSSPGQGGAESVGEYGGDITANIAPFFLAPELGIAAKGGELIGNAALAARTAGKIGQKAYGAATKWGPKAVKAIVGTGAGTAAGAVEGAVHNEDVKDPKQFADATKRGAVEGGVTTAEFMAGRLAYEALPPALKHMVQAGALTTTAAGIGMSVWDRLGHHHFIPYHFLYSLAAPILGMARGATKLPPSVIGAGAERTAQGAGYEPSGSTSSEPQDEIIGQ
jgi:hypothetical protein